MTSSLSGFFGPNASTGMPQSTSRKSMLGGDFVPKGHRIAQMQRFTPQQMELFSSLFSHAGPESYLSKLAGGDEETFNQMEAPQMRQFNELLGGIGSRFSGMGMGARRSSGFQNTASSAASNFAQQLGAQRQQMSRQALMDLMGISQSLLGQSPYERMLSQKSEKPKSGLSGLLGAGIGGVGGFFAGGPMGALSGASFGSQIGQGLF